MIASRDLGTRRWRVRVALLACVVGVLLAAPLVQVGASGDVVMTGEIALDHADDFAHDRDVEWWMLDTGSERLRIEGTPAFPLTPGMRVRARGHVVGDSLVLASSSDSLSRLPAPATSSVPASTTSATGTTTQKRVAVLLVNFVAPTPSPTPTPTPRLTPTDTPGSSDSPLPTETPLPTDSPLPTDPPIAADVAPSDSPPPADSPLPSDSPVPTDMPPPTPTAPPTPSPTPTPPSQPWTPEQVRGVYFTNTRSVAAYYADLSEGKMSINGDVFGWFTVPARTDICDYSNWGSAAREAASAAGVDLSAYTNVVYAFPKQPACWWPGLANVVGRNSWLNGAITLFVTSHELGHNFGVHHASSLSCTTAGTRVAYSSNCTSDEYGDPFDVMGFQGQRLMSNWHRWQIGFMPSSEVQTVTDAGTYRVATAEVPGGVPRILRIARPTGDFYYLEYRQPYGAWDNFSATAAVVNGVTIRIAPEPTKIIESELIDANPQTSSFRDAALGVGRTFADLVNQIFVTTTAIDSTGATVSVHFGADTTAPTAVAGVIATALPDGTVRLDWPAATDDISVAGYRVTRDGSFVATVAGLTYTDSAPAQAQTHTYEVSAVDQSGNVGTSASVSAFVPDWVAPAAVSGLTAQQTDARVVTLSWIAASDNVGIAGYRVWRDGVAVADTTETGWTDLGAKDGFESSYAVAAVDAAGNWGVPATANVSLPDATAPYFSGPLDATVSGNDVTLTWPAATDNVGVDHYVVNRDGLPLNSAAEPSYSDSGLVEAQSYAYSVSAVDAAGFASAPLKADVFVPDSVPPDGPTNVSVEQTGVRTLAAAWSAAIDNVGVDHYFVVLDGVVIATSAATSLTGIDVADGYQHELAVIAFDAAGNSSPAAIATVDVPDGTQPSTPAVTATATSATSTSVSWSAATDNIGVEGYLVRRDDGVVATVGATQTTFIDTGLASDRTYQYSVSAFDAAGNLSLPGTASAALVSKDVTAPTVPAGFKATALGGRRVSLSWNASVDDRAGTIRYQVFRGTTKVATVTTLSYVDRPATVATYKYRVRAVDGAGNKSTFTAYVSIRAIR